MSWMYEILITSQRTVVRPVNFSEVDITIYLYENFHGPFQQMLIRHLVSSNSYQEINFQLVP